MAALSWLMNLGFAATESTLLVVPGDAGLEVAFPAMRADVTFPDGLADVVFPTNRADVTFLDDD